MVKPKFFPATYSKSCKRCRYCKWEKKILKKLYSDNKYIIKKEYYCSNFKDKLWRIILEKFL